MEVLVERDLALPSMRRNWFRIVNHGDTCLICSVVGTAQNPDPYPFL